MSDSAQLYLSYDEVPFHRKQWFFWCSWFFCSPFAILILITGDVYYPKAGKVVGFGPANRIVAGIFGLLWAWGFIKAALGL